MTLKLGTKEIAVDSISKVVVTGPYTATIHFIFGNAIIVRCLASEFVDEPTYRSRFILMAHRDNSIDVFNG